MIKKIKENKYRILSIILISLCFVFCLMKIYNNEQIERAEENKIEEFINITTSKEKKENLISNENKTSKSNFLLVLEIPKINLKKGIYNFGSKNNNVEKTIQLIEKSDMPSVKNGNLILASHRGNSKVSFFNDLYKLNKEDNVFVYYSGYKYTYKIKNWYKEKKTGRLTIKRNENKNVIALITCVKNENNQVIYIGELKNKEQY